MITPLARIVTGNMTRITKALHGRKLGIAMPTGKRAPRVKLATVWTIHQARHFAFQFDTLLDARLRVRVCVQQGQRIRMPRVDEDIVARSLSENRKSTAEKSFWPIFTLIFVKYE